MLDQDCISEINQRFAHVDAASQSAILRSHEQIRSLLCVDMGGSRVHLIFHEAAPSKSWRGYTSHVPDMHIIVPQCAVPWSIRTGWTPVHNSCSTALTLSQTRYSDFKGPFPWSLAYSRSLAKLYNQLPSLTSILTWCRRQHIPSLLRGHLLECYTDSPSITPVIVACSAFGGWITILY